MLDFCLLGTGGMMPMPNRYLTSFIIRYNGTTVLVDCGEGTQIPLQELGWGFKDITIILFTHYHGDHITGLPGILYQMINADRTEDLYIYGPKGIGIVSNMVKALFPQLPFKIMYHTLDNYANILISNKSVNKWEIKSAPMSHTTPCYGYSFNFPRLPKFNPTMAKLQNIPVKYWRDLQVGNMVYDGDNIYTPEMVLGESRPGLKIMYATDTRPCENLKTLALDSDVFIGEGMYGDINDTNKAIDKRHSTFQETAKLARDANVKELWLTHFSPALPNPERYLHIAQNEFSNTILGKGLMQKMLKFKD